MDEVVLEGLVDLPLLLDEGAELEHAQLVRGDRPALPRRRYRRRLRRRCLRRHRRRRRHAAVGRRPRPGRHHGRRHRGLVGRRRRQAEGALAEGLDAERNINCLL